MPGTDGGGEWGGAAFDPETGLLYVNSNEQPWAIRMVTHDTTSLYNNNCASCHQADGKGVPPGYPPLAGNRALTTVSAVNAIRIVLNGGFAPGTAGNPRPYGMPPFGPVLDDREVAAVVTYLRASWGNDAPAVSALEVNKYRSVPLE